MVYIRSVFKVVSKVVITLVCLYAVFLVFVFVQILPVRIERYNEYYHSDGVMRYYIRGLEGYTDVEYEERYSLPINIFGKCSFPVQVDPGFYGVIRIDEGEAKILNEDYEWNEVEEMYDLSFQHIDDSFMSEDTWYSATQMLYGCRVFYFNGTDTILFYYQST